MITRVDVIPQTVLMAVMHTPTEMAIVITLVERQLIHMVKIATIAVKMRTCIPMPASAKSVLSLRITRIAIAVVQLR